MNKINFEIIVIDNMIKGHDQCYNHYHFLIKISMKVFKSKLKILNFPDFCLDKTKREYLSWLRLTVNEVKVLK